jgi:hypothetical protein
MKPSRFILVHSRDDLETSKKKVRKLARPTLTELAAAALSTGVHSVIPGLQALVAIPTLFNILSNSVGSGMAPARSIGAARPASERMAASRVTVGLWDLGAWLGSLPTMVETMNKVQETFVFCDVKATVPPGLTSRPDRVAFWLGDILERDLKDEEKDGIGDNVIANDFFAPAEAIRGDLTIDYLVGITPAMVACKEEGGSFYWNYFSTFHDRIILASVYELRDLSTHSGCPFEAILIKIIVSQLIAAMHWPEIHFHPNTGCIFDRDPDRRTIVDKVKDPHVDPECLERIDTRYHAPLRKLLALIRDYRGA